MSILSANYLRESRERFDLKAFVETGCYRGEGIRAALESGFEIIRSCDIVSQHAQYCSELFQARPEVSILNADSLSALATFLLEDLPPTFFWLDAHYPGYYGRPDLEDEATKLPLLAELELIAKHRSGRYRDFLIADDMRVFCAPDNPRWIAGEIDDDFVVRGIGIEDLSRPFLNSHSVELVRDQEGLLIFSPALT